MVEGGGQVASRDFRSSCRLDLQCLELPDHRNMNGNSGIEVFPRILENVNVEM